MGGHSVLLNRLASNEESIRQLLYQDWQQLFPLRHSHGEQIRRVLTLCPGAGLDAWAAFGLVDRAQAPAWLYRDFYMGQPPPEPSVDRAIGRLRRGDASELLALLEVPDQPESVFRHIWHEVSSLAGRPAGIIRLEPSDAACSCATRSPRSSVYEASTCECNSHVVNRHELAARMREILSEPLGSEPHRQRMLACLDDLLAGGYDDDLNTDEWVAASAWAAIGGWATASTCMELLLLHTDLPLRGPLRRARPGSQQAAGLRRALVALHEWLQDRARFTQLLRDGLRSPSRPRRFLSYRLLRLDGLMGDERHPDDNAP